MQKTTARNIKVIKIIDEEIKKSVQHFKNVKGITMEDHIRLKNIFYEKGISIDADIKLKIKRIE
ncbi:hypothetical protein ACFL43_00400 [Thermodesulfobacteriota bacterium]